MNTTRADAQVAIKSFNKFNIDGNPKPVDLPSGVNWSPAGYQTSVIAQIKRLMNSHTGRILLNATRGVVKIQCTNSYKDMPIHSNGTIRYLPDYFNTKSRLYAADRFHVGATATASLLHELVHAMRFSLGFSPADREKIPAIPYPPHLGPNMNPLTNLYFGKRAEFNAIVITNIYLSEMAPLASLDSRHRSPLELVKDHHLGHSHLRLAAPGAFHMSAAIRHYLLFLRREQPELFYDLSRVPANFNPIRDVRP